MECFFCNRNENELNIVFKPIIERIESQIARYNHKIDTIKENFAKEYSKENKEKVKKIDKNILKMKINALMDNLEPFLNIDKNLQILNNYFKKYKDLSIPKNGTLEDLMNLFICEPEEIRITHAIAQDFTERKILLDCIEKLKSYNKLHKLNDKVNIPLIVFDINDEMKNIVINEYEKHLSSQKSTEKEEQLYLCSYCMFLNKQSNKEIIRIKEKYVEINVRQNNEYREPNPLEE